MEPVGVLRRALATIVDMIIFMIILIPVSLGLASSGGEPSTGMSLLMAILPFAYYVIMEKTSGATLGKKALGLQVVRKDGKEMDWVASIVRNLLRIVDGIGFYLVGAIVIWVSKEKQRIGDMAAGTMVIRTGGD